MNSIFIILNTGNRLSGTGPGSIERKIFLKMCLIYITRMQTDVDAFEASRLLKASQPIRHVDFFFSKLSYMEVVLSESSVTTSSKDRWTLGGSERVQNGC
jgi:hypothetical protein